MMWVLVANGLVYLGFLYLHGEWRDLVPRRGDARDAMADDEVLPLRAPRPSAPGEAQRAAEGDLLLDAGRRHRARAVSGLAIWKPVTLGLLTALFGGYVWARYWHFAGDGARSSLLSLVHVFMVFAVDPYSLRSMITGGYDEARSPERATRGPFYHLLRARSRQAATIAGAPAPS